MHAENRREVIVGQGLLRRAFRGHLAVEADNVGGVVGHGGHVMADHQLGEALDSAQVIEEFAKEVFALEVDPCRGFVKHQEIGFLEEGERQEHPLHFASGQGADPAASQMLGFHQGQDIHGLLVQSAADAQPERFFLETHGQEFVDRERHAPIKGKALRHVPNLGTNAVAGELDTALVGNFIEQGQEQGGFTRPVRTDDRSAAALGHEGGNPIKDGHTATFNRYVFKADRRYHGELLEEDVSCCQGFSLGLSN